MSIFKINRKTGLTEYITQEKRRRRGYSPCAPLAFFLACVMMLSGTANCFSTVAVAVAESGDGELLADTTAFDFSLVGNPTQKADQASVVTGLLGQPITSAESEYLNAHSAYEIIYCSQVPDGSYIIAAHDDTVTALALPYSYTAANGVTLEWLPMFAEANEELFWFEWSDKDGAWRADLAGSIGTDVKITYAASIILPSGDAVNMINEAYSAATALADSRDEYEKALSDWQAKDEAYREYRESKDAYDAAVEARRNYLQELENYKILKNEYDAWWREFDLKTDAYNKYVAENEAFLANQEALKKYDDALAAYEEYEKLLEATPALKEEYLQKNLKAREHLSVMDSLFAPITESQRSFYSAISSSLVDIVISKKHELVTVGGSEKDINNSEKAAFYLRQIVNGYKDIALPEENDDKYSYYSENKDRLEEYLCLLYDSLYNLGTVKNIMDRIVKEGFDDEFCEFMSILCYFKCALSDNERFDPTVTVFGKAPKDVIYVDILPEDKDSAEPLAGGWPLPPTTSDDVEPVEHPGERPEELEEPEYVEEPDATQAPDEPTEPNFVPEPDVDEPDAVDPPGDAPTEPTRDEYENALLLAYDEGKVAYRDITFSEESPAMTQLALSEIRMASTVRITIDYFNGDRLLGQFGVIFGGSAEEKLKKPGNKVINGEIYEFVGWGYERDGEPVDVTYITSVAGRITLHALFQRKNADTEAPTEPDVDTEAPSVPDTEESSFDTTAPELTEEETTPPDTSADTTEAVIDTTEPIESTTEPAEDTTEPDDTAGEETTADETVIEETSVLDTTSDETDKPVEDTTSSEDKDTPISDTAEAEDSTTASESGNETAEESRPTVSTKPADTLDLSDIPEVSLWAKLLGKVGLVPLIIIAGGFAGALLACFVIIPVAISDRRKNRKSNGEK